MTELEKKKHMQDLAAVVYAAHQALAKAEHIAYKAGLDCRNKQNMWFEGNRGKAISVFVNGEKA